MLIISCADLIGSSAFLFDHFLLPADNSIPFAVGNTTTCKAQGVLLQLGFVSRLLLANGGSRLEGVSDEENPAYTISSALFFGQHCPLEVYRSIHL